MNIAVIKQTIAMTKDETLICGMDAPVSVVFSFDSTWDGFSKTVLFRAGATIVSTELENDVCVIPNECLTKAGITLRVLVKGTNGSETIETPWCLTSRILYETSIDIPVSPSPTPTPTPTPEGEVGRLCSELASLLSSSYSEAELEGLTLNDIMSDMDGLNNTATDEEVGDLLDDIWGSDGSDSEPSDQVKRLCDDFAETLRDMFTEEELEKMSLSDVIDSIDADNTATDDEVAGVIDDVWGP